MNLLVLGIPSAIADDFRKGMMDANGQAPQLRRAEGKLNRCRHRLGYISEGEALLLFSYRPFDSISPYSETGPIFIHKKNCEHFSSHRFPEGFEQLDTVLVRGYDFQDEIRYETGKVIAGIELISTCTDILRDESIAYVHIRSKYNCFQ